MGNAPAAHLLRMREPLKLTDEQVKRLESLNASQTQALTPSRGAALRVEADLADAMQGEGNLVAARAAMEKGAKLHIDQAILHMQAMKDARAVLNADQRAQTDAMRSMMGNARAGGMRGMPGGPGMGPQRMPPSRF